MACDKTLTKKNAETEEMVNLFRDEDILWNTHHKMYFNVNARRLALMRIAKAMGPDWTEEKVKSKWNSIKTSYSRERRKQEMTIKSGAGTEDVFSSKWWLFDVIDGFLAPHVVAKQGVNNMKKKTPSQSTSCEFDDDSMFESDSINSGSFLDLLEQDIPLHDKENVSLLQTISNHNSENSYETISKLSSPPKSIKNQCSKRKTCDITPSDILSKCSTAIDCLGKRLEGSNSNERKLTDNQIFGQFVERSLDQIGDQDLINEAKYEIHTTLIHMLRKKKEGNINSS